MFDTKTEIVIPIETPEGIKKVAVRYPTDAEFSDWRRKKKVLQKDLGRRKFRIEGSLPDKNDLELLSKIRADKDEDAPTIDEAEASHIIGRLASCEVSDRPTRVGQAFSIPLKVMGRFATVHVLGVPSMKQLFEYDRLRSGVIHGEYGRSEIRINFQAAGELYDALKQSVEGYAGAVPIPHKAEAINVLLQELRSRQEDEPEGDEDDDEG